MENIKKMIIILLTIFGILIISYVCVKIFIKIDNKSTNVNLGKYEDVTLFEKDVADKYINEIIQYIQAADYENIVKYIDRDDEKYSSLSNYSIEKEFEKLGIIGKELEILEYSTSFKKGYNNIFSYNILNKDNNSTYTIVIKEYAPNVYVFSIAY